MIKKELTLYKFPSNKIEILPSTEVITMNDNPVKAFKQKPKSSLVVGCHALRESIIDVLITPGNTGATLATALFVVGRIKGVKRPAIAITFPTSKGNCIILDGGANMNCKPKYLKQFAIILLDSLKLHVLLMNFLII